jgi:hypothetical protein
MRLWFESVGVRLANSVMVRPSSQSIGGSICCSLRLDEQQRRWFVAHESQRIGFGGDVRMSQVTGLNVDTIARGRAELSQDLAGRPTDRVRLPGAGRPPVEKKIRH